MAASGCGVIPEGDLSSPFHLSTDGRLKRRMQDPAGDSDLADLTIDPQDGRPRLLGWRSTEPRQAALAAADAARLTALQARFPGPDESAMARKLLVRWTASDGRARRWW